MDDKKSTLGNTFIFGSGAITWSTKKQETMALSSSEAEYVAITIAAKQALWIRKLLADFHLEQGAVVICCDNGSAIAMDKNPTFYCRIKHIVVQHHFLCKLVTDSKITLQFCGTTEQNVDIFTKSLSQPKHYFLLLN